MNSFQIPDTFDPLAVSLRDRVILVTGAGQGVGRFAATCFAAHGATVVLHGRNTSKIESTYDEICAAGGPDPALVTLDFANATQRDLDGLAHTIHGTFGRLDGIVHAASHFLSTTPMPLIDLDSWLLHARLNLAVPAALTRACWPMLARSPDASVIFLTETHAVEPAAYWGAYAATKSALATLVSTWAAEVSGPSPRVNLLLPGAIATPMRARSHPGELSDALPPLSTLAPALLFLASTESQRVSGHLIEVQESRAR